MITENLSTLKINKLTQEQYDRESASGNIDENALYLIPDKEIDLTPYATTRDVSLTYETKSDAVAKLNEAKTYTDSVLSDYSDEHMSTTNPVGTGSFSMNRKADSQIGDFSCAVGAETTASGIASYAEGMGAIASGTASHVEGAGAIASGTYSHVEGQGTIGSSSHQHVQGKYNIEDTEDKYAHIVGNGSNIARSNAHTLDWNGNAWFAGNVYVGGTKQDEGKQLVTKEYVDALFATVVEIKNYLDI